MDLRNRETARVVLAAVYLSTFSTAVPHTYPSTETAWAQPTTEIEPPTPLPPLQPPALANPLQAGELNRLRTIALEAIQKSPIQSKTVVGIHHVRLNPFVVQQVLKSNPANSAPKVFVELPNKQSAVIVTDSLQPAQDSVMWKGHVEGVPGSRVRFMVNPTTNAIYGSVEKGRFIYEIRPSPSDTSVIEILAIDPSGFPPEHGALIRQAAGMSSVLRMLDDRVSGPLKLTAGGDPPMIDVMILYTTAARDQDPNGIAAMACQAVEDLKEAFANSGIQATARLVHHGIADKFTEATSRRINDNLDALRDAGNTASNDIFELRKDHKADVVSLWVSDALGTDCGMSPYLDNNLTPNANLAFSVVVRKCALSNRSFVHEVGHVLQANHDRYVEQARNKPDYNYGYVKADEGWMTVMSYHRPDCPLEDILDKNGDPVIENGVKQQRHACNRRLHWSNPSVDDPVWGDPMGRTQGFPIPANACTDNEQTQWDKFQQQNPVINCDGPADNARILNSTVTTVANFRTGGILGNVSCVANNTPDPPPAAPTNLTIQ
jgi:hypothetical protein